MLKAEYNKQLQRFYNAEIWLNDECRSEEEIKKYMGAYQQIGILLGKLLDEMKKQGINYTNAEVVSGFKDI